MNYEFTETGVFMNRCYDRVYIDTNSWYNEFIEIKEYPTCHCGKAYIYVFQYLLAFAYLDTRRKIFHSFS